MKILAAILMFFFIAVSPVWANPSFRTKANAVTGALYADKNGIKEFYCSGAVFEKKNSEYLFVTAGHCINDDNSWFFPSKVVFYVSFSENEKGPFYLANTWKRSALDDIAIFVLNNIPPIDTIPLGDETKLTAGDPVFNVSFINDSGKLNIFGWFIAPKFPHFPDFLSDKPWHQSMPINILVAPGSSGSAIFDEKQQAIIGIVVGYDPRSPSYCIAIPASRIRIFRNQL